MRTLLEENYELRYSSCLCPLTAMTTSHHIFMHTDHQDVAPYKLYYGLKGGIPRRSSGWCFGSRIWRVGAQVYNGNITPLTNRDKRIRMQYFRNELGKVLAPSMKMNPAGSTDIRDCFLIFYWVQPLPSTIFKPEVWVMGSHWKCVCYLFPCQCPYQI